MVGGLILNIGIPGFLFSFDERLFLRVLLPPICFEASLSINKVSSERSEAKRSKSKTSEMVLLAR